MTSSAIEFRDIPGFPGLKACSDGTIWTQWSFVCRKGQKGFSRIREAEFHLLEASLSGTISAGYRHVRAHHESGKAANVRVHVLVLLAFQGERPTGCGRQEARHLDGNKLNNQADNLAWGTMLDNKEDAARNGGTAKNKLTRADVAEIHRLRAETQLKQAAIARRFGVHPAHVSRILGGRNWGQEVTRQAWETAYSEATTRVDATK